MGNAITTKKIRYTITYKRLDGSKLKSVKYDYVTRLLVATGEPNPLSCESHIRGLRNNGGQNALPGGYDEGFVGIIEIEGAGIKRTLRFDTPILTIRE